MEQLISWVVFFAATAFILETYGQSRKNTTYCNPLNLDYGYTPIPDFSEAGRHRATADPVIVRYKGDYFLFSTNQWGYWWSNDLSDWHFNAKKFLRPWNKVYDELCAPAVGIIGDTMLVFGSTYTSEFTVWMSTNPKGNEWKTLVDKSINSTDVPHDYIELKAPVRTRYLRLENIHVPAGKFAVSGFRVFGHGNGKKPEKVKNFVVLRTEKDKRSAWLKWYPSHDAFACNIYMGTESGKLYNCIMVYSANEYWLKTIDSQKTYYFTIEAINENGISGRTKIIEIK